MAQMMIQLLAAVVGLLTAAATTWALWQTSTFSPNGDDGRGHGPPVELAPGFVVTGLVAGVVVCLFITRGVFRDWFQRNQRERRD